MVRTVISQLFFWLAVAGAVFAAYRATVIDGDPALDETAFRSLLPYAWFLGAAWLAGYLASLDPRARRRPWFGMLAGATAPGFTVALALYAEYSMGLDDGVAWAAGAGGGLASAAAALAVELLLRWISWAAVRGLDQKNMGGAALWVGRFALLWRPGQENLLRSVSLERFRRGVRGEVATHLKELYESGDRGPDLLELLCKLASEEKRPADFLRHLGELRTQFPDDEDLNHAYLEELLEQGRDSEALEFWEGIGVDQDDEDALARYGLLLIAATRLDDAVKAASRLGQVEGIPMQRSDELLRRVLNLDEKHLGAVNVLADQARRRARKDQETRWLLKSWQLHNRQPERRERLVELLESASMNRELEEVLADMAHDAPANFALGLRYARLVFNNGKTEDAAEFLDSLRERGCDTAQFFHTLAQVCAERGDQETAREAAESALEKGDGLDDDQVKDMRGLLRGIEEAQLTAELAGKLDEANANPNDLDLQCDVLARLAERRPDRAVAHLDTILSNHPAERPRLIAELESIRTARGEAGLSFQLSNTLADLQVEEGRLDDALETVVDMSHRAVDPFTALRDGAQKILRRSPHHLETLGTIGQMYREMGQFVEMVHAYSLYLANGGEQTEEINRAMATAYLSLEDFDNATRFVLSLIDRRIERRHEDAGGPAEAGEGDDRDVLLLKRAIGLGVEKRKANAAAEMMQRLEQLQPASRQTKALRTRVNEALGAERLAFLKRELDAGNADEKALEEVGDLCREAGDFAQAINYYQRAARQKGATRVPMTKLAYCFAKERMFDLASETLSELRLSLQDDPAELEAVMDWIYQSAEVFEQARMFERAAMLFKQLMKIDAGYRDVLGRFKKLGVR